MIRVSYFPSQDLIAAPYASHRNATFLCFYNSFCHSILTYKTKIIYRRFGSRNDDDICIFKISRIVGIIKMQS
mgnify:CR=1 FL=1